MIHLGNHVGEEKHLPVAGARDQGVLGLFIVGDDESPVEDAVFSSHRLEIHLPALSVRWIGKEEVELHRGEGVMGKGGPLGAADDVVGILPFPFQQHVGLADGVRLRIDLLPIHMRDDLVAARRR